MKRKAPYIGRQQEATRYPTHEGYVASIPPANPVIPMRGSSLAWMGMAAALVTSQFFPLVPAVAEAVQPSIPYRIAQVIPDLPSHHVPSQYQAFPYYTQPTNPIPVRTSPVEFPPSEQVNPSAFFKVPSYQEAVAPANPVIPILTRPLSELRDASATHYSSFSPYTYTDNVAAAPANPPIFFRGVGLTGLFTPPSIPRQSSYNTYEVITTYPNIPIRIGQWIGDAPVPKLTESVLFGGRFGYVAPVVESGLAVTWRPTWVPRRRA